jgi:hypothetical protein
MLHQKGKRKEKKVDLVQKTSNIIPLSQLSLSTLKKKRGKKISQIVYQII